MIRPHVLRSALGWLLKGYPDGIPTKDYSPILALLRRQQLTDEEVDYVAARLVQDAVTDPDGLRHPTREDVEHEIEGFTHEEPEDADIQRVAARLGTPTWPTPNNDTSHASL